MPWKTSHKVVVAVAAMAMMSPAYAGNLAYVRASSMWQAKTHAAQYHPIYLLDNNPETLWCEGAEGLGEGEEIWMFFKKTQSIDRLLIAPTQKSGRIIEEVVITDGSSTVRIALSDRDIDKTFNIPMRGKKFIISISRVGGPVASSATPKDVACLADVILYRNNKAFGGMTPPSHFRYDQNRDRVLGVWNGGALGAPEKFLTFAIDGTWGWRLQPLLGGTTRRLSGEYRFRGRRLLMRKGETGRWVDVRFRFESILGDEDIGIANDYVQIWINPIIDAAVGGSYNNAEF